MSPSLTHLLRKDIGKNPDVIVHASSTSRLFEMMNSSPNNRPKRNVTVSIRHYLSLFFIICHNSSSFVIVRHYSSLFVIIRHYSSTFFDFLLFFFSLSSPLYTLLLHVIPLPLLSLIIAIFFAIVFKCF